MNATPLYHSVTQPNTHISLRWGALSIHLCVVPKQGIAVNFNCTKHMRKSKHMGKLVVQSHVKILCIYSESHNNWSIFRSNVSCMLYVMPFLISFLESFQTHNFRSFAECKTSKVSNMLFNIVRGEGHWKHPQSPFPFIATGLRK